jgi:hypothetical protein
LDGVVGARELVNDGTREGDCATRVLLLTTFDDDELVYGRCALERMALCSSMLLLRDLVAAIGRAQPGDYR